jgi:diguanylate cyclase (GGDEF)-like protein
MLPTILKRQRDRLGLKSKLRLAFLSIAFIGVLSGLAGLAYVQSIAGTLSVYADVTAPLVRDGDSLVDDVDRMHTAYKAALDDTQDADRVKGVIAERNIDALDRIDRIGGTARTWLLSGSHSVQFGQTALSQTRFARSLAGAIDRKVEADLAHTAVEARGREIHGAITHAEGRLLKLIADTEADLTSRVVTPTAWGVNALVALNRVMREAARLRDVTQGYDALTRQSRVREVDATILQGVSQAEENLRRASARSRTDAIGSEILALNEEWANLRSLYVSPEGLFALKQRDLDASKISSEAERVAEGHRAQALDVTGRVNRLVQDLNEQARGRSITSAQQACYVFAALVLISFAASLLIGNTMSTTLLSPLARLTQRANLIGRSAGERLPPDPKTADRRDEIGVLSRAFDAMLIDLAAAREQILSDSRAEMKAQISRLNAALANMVQGLCMYDSEGRLIVVNRRCADLYGIEGTLAQDADTVLIEGHSQLLPANAAAAIIAERQSLVASRHSWTNTDYLTNGRTIAVSGSPMEDGGCVVTYEDITDRREAQQRIAHLAYHDGLTGLPNRTRFNEHLTDMLNLIGPSASLATLCLDLDRFKAVNDTLGHPIGDALLTEVAVRIKEEIGSDDLVARLGGDEFAVIQVGGQQPNAARDLAERLIARISESYQIEGHHIDIGTSVGVSLAPQDGATPETILKHADMALYRAKSDGRGTVRFFEAEMDHKMQARRKLELDLREAVAQEAFELHYQPLVNLTSLTVTGFESLLRWRHPEKGPISPAEFVPLLEEIGLIGRVGAWVLKAACREAATWPGEQKIAVNLSAVQFRNRSVVLDVAAALMESGLKPGRLELEITESILLHDTRDTLAILNELRSLGVRISMDDFGTGYSSLSYLRSFPFDKIKIDQSFVRDMNRNEDAIAIIRAVTGLGKSLGMVTTAEGVETVQQFDKLKGEGCTEVQGYYLSRPKPAAEVPAMIADITGRLQLAA